MNKQQKEVQQQFLDNEKAILKRLKETYQDAIDEINSKIEILMARQDADMQHVIYQVEYQKALKSQIQGILDNMQANEFESISEYLTSSYEDGFIGAMYDMQKQGVPLVMPIDQEQVIAAIQHETKLSENLYTALGKDVKDLQKKIAGEISRGIAGGQMFSEIARNISGYAGISRNNAVRIARTEGHRIQCKAASDAQWKAKSKGADVVKQWDSALDGKTRPHHRELDGQIRELDEPFEAGSMKAMMPGGFNIAAEDINCRCALLQRARWALEADIPVTKWSEDAPVLIADDGTTQFVDISDAKNYKQFKERYQQQVVQGAQKMKPKNKNGEEIHFQEAMESDEKWKESLDIIKSLSNEYDTYLTEVRWYEKGENTRRAAGDVSHWGRMRLSSRKKSTAIHEFAHSLSSINAEKEGTTNCPDFWKEIRKVRTEYKKARRTDPRISISYYAEDSIDEFFAEAFTQAKMKQLGLDYKEEYGEDTTYSDKVLAIADKYFKKKPLENVGKSSTMELEGMLPIDLQFFGRGKDRADKYESNWSKLSLEETVKKFVPNAKQEVTPSGKINFTSDSSNYSVCYDTEGDYFRIERKDLKGKRRYTDTEGNNVSNITENGKTRGRTTEEYESMTHFKNIDKDGD